MQSICWEFFLWLEKIHVLFMHRGVVFRDRHSFISIKAFFPEHGLRAVGGIKEKLVKIANSDGDDDGIGVIREIIHCIGA